MIIWSEGKTGTLLAPIQLSCEEKYLEELALEVTRVVIHLHREGREIAPCSLSPSERNR